MAWPYKALAVSLILIAIVKAPVTLDAQSERELAERAGYIIKLDAKITKLSEKPMRSPAEEHKYAVAKAALDELGQGAVTVLRHLKIHGTVTIKQQGEIQPWPPLRRTGVSAIWALHWPHARRKVWSLTTQR